MGKETISKRNKGVLRARTPPFWRVGKSTGFNKQVASSSSGGGVRMNRTHLTSDLIGADQKIPNWLIKITFLGKVCNSALVLDLALVSWTLVQATPSWACDFCLMALWRGHGLQAHKPAGARACLCPGAQLQEQKVTLNCNISLSSLVMVRHSVCHLYFLYMQIFHNNFCKSCNNLLG